MYGDGEGDAISRDMNSVLYSSTFKHPSDGEFAKIKQLISSDEKEGYRSAPTSFFFANLLNGCDDFVEAQEPKSASETIQKHQPLGPSSNLISHTGFLSPSATSTANGFGEVRHGSSSDISLSSASIISSQKGSKDGDLKMFSNRTQNGDSGHLIHHMSLPKTSLENFLQFQQETVPCKIRAKRGFATHPRSIAERVRRTRISDRMKKLQELFPNMDKQINTAEMLDMAVECIKDLQKEVKTLNDTRARCMCSSKELHPK